MKRIRPDAIICFDGMIIGSEGAYFDDPKGLFTNL